MAGTIPLSLTQQFDEFGAPLGGGLLYIYQAGTVATPQQPYQDTGLSILMPNPIPLDAAGRVPQFFLADGTVKIRLDSRTGINQITKDGVLVIGPSSGGGGGGGSVDPTTILQTGMLSMFYGVGSVAGFVRANGRTIGSASSGASERANADCNALFQFLWNADSNLTVSTGRGANSATDWAANKTITLPDWRGRTIAGLDDMGNTAAGRLTTTYWGGNGIVLGQSGGVESNALTAANQIPQHDHAVFLKDNQHFHSITNLGAGGTYGGSGSGTPWFFSGTTNTDSKSSNITIGSVNGVANDNKTALNAGGGAGFRVMQPTMLCTIYLKL